MKKLILIRHGQSKWNVENRFTGWKNPDLTEFGKKEARNTGVKLKDEKIDLAFTSKLLRAQHTLKIILEERNKKTKTPIFMDEALNARSYGDLEGLNKDEIANKYGKEQIHILRRSFEITPPGGESLKDIYNRVIPFYKANILPQLEQNKNILIIAHDNSLRVLIMYLEDVSPTEMLKREIETGTPINYAIDEQMNVIKLK